MTAAFELNSVLFFRWIIRNVLSLIKLEFVCLHLGGVWRDVWLVSSLSYLCYCVNALDSVSVIPFVIFLQFLHPDHLSSVALIELNI